MSEKEIVYVESNSAGNTAGIIAIILAILGILTLGTIFVPLAAIVALFGTIGAFSNMNISGIGINILAWVLVVIGVATSPVLLAIIIGSGSQ
jgi:hypothetical protein